jgi:hypothetical protein
MTLSWERLLQGVRWATVLVALAVLVHAGVAVAENPGCMNNQCKDINVRRNCSLGTDFVQKYITCFFCKPASGTGRCDVGNANNRSCTPQTQMQVQKIVTATLICDCPDGVNSAERTATYTDDNWGDPYGVRQYLCTGT